MQLNRFDELNQLGNVVDFFKVDNKEWFEEFPLDADIRVEYCERLEDLMFDYLSDCEESESNIEYTFLFLIYVTWLTEIANIEFNNVVNSLELFENEYEIEIEKLSDKFAKMVYESEYTLRFNEKQQENTQDYQDESIEDIETQEDKVDTEILYLAMRSRTIARTETNRVCNAMIHKQAKKLFKKHIWVSERDKKVRKTHVKADGQIKDINEPFEVGKSLLLFPCDDSYGASAEEIVNCRCHEEFSEPIIND